MKTSLLTTILIFLFGSLAQAQSVPPNSLYFGQTPPGDSAIIFSPDFISTNLRYVQSSSYSMDGSEFCFVQTNSQWSSFKIKYTQYVNDHWSDPVDLYFLGNNINVNANLGPCFSPDSSRFFLNESFVNIWYSVRNGDIWSKPIKIPAPVSSLPGRGEPSVSHSNTLFLAENGKILYSEFQDSSYLETKFMKNPINTTSSTGDPHISPEEDYLIVSSNRTGNFGQYDLYISYKKTDGKWTNPKNLGPKINTTDWECVPSVTPDGKYLLFTRREKWITSIPSKIYWVSSSFIDSLKLTNFDPYVLNQIPNQTDTTGQLFNYTIADSTFIDDDGNNTLTFHPTLTNGDPWPGWLSFDTIAGTFSGIPDIAQTLNFRITATDDAGASVSTSFKLVIKLSTAVNQINDQNVKIFPNPTTGRLNITGDAMRGKRATVEMSNLEGKLIQATTFNNAICIDLASKPKGIYILKLVIDNEIIIRKIGIWEN